VASRRNVHVQKNDVIVLEDRNVERRLIHGRRLLLKLRRRRRGQCKSKNDDGYESRAPQSCLLDLSLLRFLEARYTGKCLAKRAATVAAGRVRWHRSEEHTSELQSRFDLVCRL